VPGQWTPGQREALGLPSRADLAQMALAAWRVVLGQAHVDVLSQVIGNNKGFSSC
jgi:ATP-dependent helicase/nuclease subunit B